MRILPILHLRTDQIVNPVALATGDAPLAGDYRFRESPHEARVKLGLMPSPSLRRRRVDQINISMPTNIHRLFFAQWIRSWSRTKTNSGQILLEPDPGGRTESFGRDPVLLSPSSRSKFGTEQNGGRLEQTPSHSSEQGIIRDVSLNCGPKGPRPFSTPALHTIIAVSPSKLSIPEAPKV
ncbi:hypothetical protein N7510_001847 [Penicillium lagena]|uniref:uncharacterized protein n=1 Tax=Penicillium lagena TaxID=94218 RepID=UPI002541CD42|nr:uncharacterized protein N7510_001847 [Penicillium lagena]KAJ5625538.1 hypothetical protein N7510_001847 [Penicillium lagena]